MVNEKKEFEDYATLVKNAISNVVNDYEMGEQDKPRIIYATPPAAFADFAQDTINGQQPGPLISFYLENIEIDKSNQLGGFKTLLIDKTYKFRAPIIARLTYKVTINAIKESQADLLQSQIVMGMPFNRPYAAMINGQWATLEASGVENSSSVEIETDNDKISTRSGAIIIDRAYFNYPIQVNTRFIKSINSHIFSMEKKQKFGGRDENN